MTCPAGCMAGSCFLAADGLDVPQFALAFVISALHNRCLAGLAQYMWLPDIECRHGDFNPCADILHVKCR
jgi:hypothetical protein